MVFNDKDVAQKKLRNLSHSFLKKVYVVTYIVNKLNFMINTPIFLIYYNNIDWIYKIYQTPSILQYSPLIQILNFSN
jgi:hypothetical protein